MVQARSGIVGLRTETRMAEVHEIHRSGVMAGLDPTHLADQASAAQVMAAVPTILF